MANNIPEKYRKNVKKAMINAAALGTIGAFSTAADVAGIVSVWGKLLIDVAAGENVSLSKENAAKICSGIAIGAGGYYAGCYAATKCFEKLLHFIPVGGTVIAMGCSSVQNMVFTYYFAAAIIGVMSVHNIKEASDIVTKVVKVFRHFTMFDVGEMASVLLG